MYVHILLQNCNIAQSIHQYSEVMCNNIDSVIAEIQYRDVIIACEYCEQQV